MDVNAEFQHTAAMLDSPILYPSSYVVMGLHGYTKHYYAGAERICAKIGEGFGAHFSESRPDLQETADKLFGQSRDDIHCRELPQNDVDCIVSYGHVSDEELNARLFEMPDRLYADVEIDLEWFHHVVELCEHESGDEEMAFFYHSDHLGSASWITERHGDAVQHLQYLPFGERYIDQHPFGYQERFTFTGKERDEETGYGYFGARYMDHELMTMWLSVDPMADKYPSISPYAYCNWNPVKLVDPDGRDVWEVDETGHVKRTGDDGGKKKQTVKYANGNASTFRGAKYHAILSDLSMQDDNNVSSSYGGENMQSAYANVFKSMADNTSVEWTMHRYKDNHYALGTMHNESLSPSSFDISKGQQHDGSLVTIIHSHPMVSGFAAPTSTASQISSMGYWDWGNKRWRRAGDAWYKKYNYRNTNYYTYFPRTKQLWSIGLNQPAFVRNINSVPDFFFGTYNTR